MRMEERVPYISKVSDARALEFFMLHDARADGPVLGYFADREIAEAVTDHFGTRYIYAGLAPKRRDGRFDVDALRPGEFILAPGLIYRVDADAEARRSRTFRLPFL
jgi:hypothetical protein